MKKRIQNIKEILEQNKKLTAKEKQSVMKALEDVDKELEVTAFKLERTEQVKKTTATLLEETIEELEQKRKAVEAQNRELEIEASLERVRSVVLEMKKQDDLMDVAKALLRELNQLGFTGIRNAQIDILDEEKKTYLNYLHSDYGVSGITENSYDNSPFHRKFINDVKSSPDALFFMEIKGKKLDGWREQRKKTVSLDDPMLEKISALYFYSYSIGSGAVGVSTFEPIDNSKLEIIKKFRNVFFLSYRRFRDIVLAEKQAREAQIEAALERVRAKSMAMHHTSELQEVVNTVAQQLHNMEMDITGGVFITINNEVDKELTFWGASGAADSYVQKTSIPFLNRPIYTVLRDAVKKRKRFLVEEYTREEKIEFFKHLFKHPPYNSSSPERKKQLLSREGGYTRSVAVSKNTSIFIINHQGRKFSDADNEILKRFGKVFEQSYTRFLDLQKAEDQAREAQIELALERIRARTMAMQHSDELAETAVVLFQQFSELGEDPDQLSIGIVNETEKVLEIWLSVQGTRMNRMFKAPIDEPIVIKKIYTAWKKQKKSLVLDISGDELKKYNDFRNSLPEFKEYNVVKNRKSKEENRRVMYCAFFPKGLLSVATPEPRPAETVKLLERFAGVFDLTYTRFLDLKKAEAQAREAQIQLALERIRARTMAMHKSDELAETAEVLFQQMTELSVTPERITIGLIKEETKVFEVWSTDQEGIKINHQFNVSLDEPTSGKRIYEAWKEKKKSLIIDLSGQELNDWIRYVREVMGMTIKEELVREHRIHSVAFFSHGMVLTTTPEPLPEESMNLLERFADVFNLTYRRFLDLKQAEAQAREAQIETALERVRSRTMGMQKSEELKEVIQLVYEQFVQLNIFIEHTGFIMDYKTRDDLHIWLADQREIPSEITIPCFDSTPNNSIKEAKENGQDFFTYLLTFEEKNKFYRDLFKFIPDVPEESLEYYFNCPGLAGSGVLLKNVGLYIENFSGTPYTDEENNTLMRFGKVFQQTYTRFLDLQKAEAQAREAQIEASLERVRAKAMAMHKSDDLSLAVKTIFYELDKLNLSMLRCGIGILNKEKRSAELWTTTITQGKKTVQVSGDESMDIHPLLQGAFEAWLQQKDFSYLLKGEDLKKYYTALLGVNFKLPQSQSKTSDTARLKQYYYVATFKAGVLFAFRETEFPEESKIVIKRFADVFNLTYTRFQDLQHAEAQAREAIKQSSLDRVRGEIASMRTSEDLNRITPIIWHELETLEVPFIRCGVFIVNEENKEVRVYLTTPEGKSLGVLNLAFDANELTSNTVKHWKKNQVYKEHWNKEEFINWTKSMIEIGQVQNAKTYQGSSTPPESLDLHFVPFTQGMLYVGNISPLTDEKLELVKTLADAFSIAYARYEDFKNIEEAKNKIEITLKELKSTQAQLIHSEKLASLGELTAGIAHEIKNPLNFVNNFSDVSRELLDEMKEELQNKNDEEVLEIIESLKQNLEKINQHGKRADSIVKGMLLHSRGTSGEKMLTDINNLLDEYVNLAYHGMRAQNQEFNITMEKDYDKTLEKINVVPQDISRVFMNIISNACYAAFDKKKTSGGDFDPVLKVSTKNLDGKVEIRIGDNGNGIPADILDKIFQPFFTTKPTGEGTGLGLSLSYDIITKVHGGEIRLESEEGKFTEFIIILPK